MSAASADISRRPSRRPRAIAAGLCALVILALWPAAVRAQQTFFVTSTAEYGTGTLRQAIESANGNQNPGEVDVIAFSLETAPPFVLSLFETTLPQITQPVRIDATTQPGFDGTPPFVIDGGQLPGSFDDGLYLATGSAGSEIRGLSVVNFSRYGIFVRSDSNTVAGSYFGLNPEGDAAGNQIGVVLSGMDNVLTGNVASANEAQGVMVGGQRNLVAGNLIGTDPSGTVARGNGYGESLSGGLLVRGTEHTIGGTTSDLRNVISGNAANGIRLGASETGAENTTIVGNYVGTDITGDAALPNGWNGIAIANTFGTTWGNIVGGTAPGAANRIAFNEVTGVVVAEDDPSATVTNNVIRGNEIFANGVLGIDLGGNFSHGDGPTANDAGDADVGPNRMQNHPLVTGASYDGSGDVLTAAVRVDTDPLNATYPLVIDFYLADADRQEGKTYIGSATYTATDYGSGSVTDLTFSPLTAPATTDYLLATATDGAGNTSEFSAPVSLAKPEISVAPSSLDFGQVVIGQTTTDGFTIENTGGSDLEIEAITVTGASSSSFSVTAGGGPATLPPGATRQVDVAFTPTSAGAKSAAVEIASNAAAAVVDLSGDAAANRTFTVTTTSEYGEGSLRRAMQLANANQNPAAVDVIEFDISGTAPISIALAEIMLPAITQPVRIDATTQPGYDGRPVIVIDGARIFEAPDGLRLAPGSAGSEINGLSIINFNGDGIEIRSDSNRIAGSFVGVDAGGSPGANSRGVTVYGMSNTLEGNLVSANEGHGITVYGDVNVVQDNLIGTDPAGMTALGNEVGITVIGNGNTIGGTASGEPNSIAFNRGAGAIIAAADSFAAGTNNAVRGNRIFANGSLGIDLGGNVPDGLGRTANDPGDGDAGPNRYQNFPVVTDIAYSRTQDTLTVTYQVPTDPANAAYPLTVDFYVTGEDRQEGKFFLGSDSYTSEDADAGTEYSVTFAPQIAPEALDAVVATATDADGNTSEFGEPVTVRGPAVVVSSLDFGQIPVGEAAQAPLVVENGGGTDLSIGDIYIAGADSTAFAADVGELPILLPPGATRALELAFTPERTGEHAATLVLESAVDTAQAALTGTAVTATTVDVVPDSSASLGTEFGVTAEPSSPVALSGTLFYRPSGSASYSSVSFAEGEGGAYRAAVPAAAMTLRGLEYYVELSIGDRVLTVPEGNPAENPLHLRVTVPEATSALAFQPRTYRMISVPVELDAIDASAHLTDDFGQPGAESWRLLRWDPETEAYRELPDTAPSFEPGQAYWLITEEGGDFDVENGQSVASEEAFALMLAPGWNQIANPFAFPVAWSNIETNTQIEAPVLFDAGAPDPWQFGQEILRPWEGYFVYNTASEPVSISVPPIEASAEGQASEQARAQPDYSLQLHAEVDRGRLVDAHNYIGFDKRAATGAGPMDTAEPPGIGDHVRLSILGKQGARLAESYVPAGKHGRRWDVEVAVSQPDDVLATGEQVAIAFRERGQLPEGYDKYVLDLDEGRRLPVEGRGVTVEVNRDQPVRRLRVIIGTREFAESQSAGMPLEPVSFSLRENYPNPFTGGTTIRYSLERRCAVTLDVFNVLGQRVATLVDAERSAGWHEVRWEAHGQGGRSVASGTYIYRLRACSFTKLHKMTLLH